MSYLIAIATNDGENVNQTFGQAPSFTIVKVEDDKTWSVVENRAVVYIAPRQPSSLLEQVDPKRQGCGCSCNGADGIDTHEVRVNILSDCRCVLCSKIGFSGVKALESKKIIPLDVVGPVKDSVNQVVDYFYRLDNHLSMRGRNSQ